MPSKREKEKLFELVSRQHSGLIARIALSSENDPALRRELIQDIMLAIWVALDSYRSDASLKTFVAAIAQKRSITHLTRRAREPRQEELPPDLASAALTPDEVAMEKDLKKQLVEAIQLLPLPQREAIVLFFEGFSYAEMAQVLGITPNAALLRCQRARDSLKTMMDKRS